MEWLTTWTIWHWLILGFALLIGETFIPGVFLLWWGLSAIAVSGIMALFPAFSLTTLTVIYAVLALILSIIWWKYQHNRDTKDQQNSSLNQRDHAMRGAIGIVKAISENNIGRGHFGDTTWRIKGNDLHIGDVIEVYKVEGITLFVNKVNKKEVEK